MSAHFRRPANLPPADPIPVSLSTITLRVNGELYPVEIEHHRTLLEVLREKLDLTGAKAGCDRGECGSCTVLVGGAPIYACQMLVVQVGERPVLTIEGLAGEEGLHPIQQAFVDNDGAQCGFCTPGFLLSAKALLDANPRPTRRAIQDAMSGNICRCNAYGRIIHSIQEAAKGRQGDIHQGL